MRLVAIGEAIEHGAYRGRRAEEECTGSGTLQGRNRSRAQDRKACGVRRHLRHVSELPIRHTVTRGHWRRFILAGQQPSFPVRLT